MDIYDISGAFGRIEDELIASMIRNLGRHRAEEGDMGFNWVQWQVEELKALEKYKRYNRAKYGREFENLNNKIEAAIKEMEKRGGTDAEREILKQIENGFTPPGSGMKGLFFHANQRKLDALIKATTDDMKKAEVAILRMANDRYRRVIFDAQMYAASGAGTYEKAVDMATKDMAMSGLNCVQYKNGARHRLEDYADMAIRTAGKRAYLYGEGERRQAWGITTVIVNKRTGACPKCLPWCGKVFIDDVWSGGTASDGDYPLLSSAVEAGLYHPRCRDSHTTYFPGISKADGKWTKEELQRIGKYEHQRALRQYEERQAEKWQRVADTRLDPENREEAEAKAKEWEDKVYKPRDLTARREQRLAEMRAQKPDFSQMDAKQLKAYAADKLKTQFTGLEGVGTENLREAVKVISQFEEKMGGNTIDGLTVHFGDVPKGTYAKYDDETKTLILRKGGSIQQFEESLKKENLRYRTKWKTDKDYHATETYSGTIWHELGHAVDIEAGQAYSRALSATTDMDEKSVKVSAYAGSTQNVRVSKRSEAWAENFAAYMDGGKNGDRVPAEIAKMIEESFRGTTVRKTKIIEGVKFIDSTELWRTSEYKPSVITNPREINLNGEKYVVNGRSVKIDYSEREAEVAKILSEHTGKKVTMGPKISGKANNVQCPDFFIGEEWDKWDYKELTGASKDAIRNSIKNKEKQAHKFIIDVSGYKGTVESAISQAENVFSAYNTQFVEEIIILNGDKIVRVLKKK